MKALYFSLCFAGTLGLVGAGQKSEPWTGYKSWKTATAAPQDMSPGMALSCVGPMKHDMSPNPHMPKVFVVYVNAIGRKAMLNLKDGDFPVGTVIVKEKFDRSNLDLKGETPSRPKIKQGAKPELLTIMEKTRTGWIYNAANGQGSRLRGNTQYCRSCHETAKAADFVFRPYVRPFRGGSYR